MTPKDGLQKNPPQYEYATVRLTPEQSHDCLKALEAMDETSYDRVSSCFEPHHRIDMVGRDSEVTSMLVCFECDALRLEKKSPWFFPKGLLPVLRATLKAVGMEEKKEWGKLALERQAKEAAGKAATEGGADKKGSVK